MARPNIKNESQYREPWHIVDEFNSTYWSGLDTNIFINGIHIDEMVSIQYQIVEQVTPYYGYSYYTAQRMHRGQRIISGSFLINFKQPGYIFKILKQPQKSSSPSSSSTEQSIQKTTSTSDILLNEFISNSNTIAGVTIPNINIPSVKSSSTQNEKAPKMPESERQKLFEKLALEGWNAPDTYTEKYDKNKYKYVGNSRMALYGGITGGLTIKIVFGNPVETSMTLKKNSFGEYEKNLESGVLYEGGVVSAVEVLAGVEITGLSKVVDDSGRSIMEQYSFLARDYQDLTPNFRD